MVESSNPWMINADSWGTATSRTCSREPNPHHRLTLVSTSTMVRRVSTDPPEGLERTTTVAAACAEVERSHRRRQAASRKVPDLGF
ncbi:hypothetical protein [Umezawaea sp. Da 62-37]|uniref:hypothetical protein n=1 Tax=Umezawaea sp. Da 62-37 TaxID=3075927 RepID=UPI0028F6D8EC|nr:hypothetical protein [Umezawaea sp. Da 62-37]WNV92200.1 hypothetical protein RM788_45565 [Umezawaea sp. Da 62-37]